MNLEKLKKEIQKIIILYNKEKKGKEKEILNYSEKKIQNVFVLPLFEALGWNINDLNEVDREYFARAGFVDVTLSLRHGLELNPVIFIETKRFGGVPHISQRNPEGTRFNHDISLDWTDEERHLVNYAAKTVDVTWAILTNFEKFRLFNARTGDTLINIESPDQYLKPENLENLVYLSKENVQNKTIERLYSNLVREELDINFLALLNTFRQVLANNIYEKFGKTLEFKEIKRIVQRILDRLIIIRYAEDYWILGQTDQLHALYENWLAAKQGSLTQMLQDFFAGIDKFRGSKLFEPDEIVDNVFEYIDDDILGEIIDQLYGVSFRKFTSDILGNTYESYLGNTLIKTNGILKLQTDYKLQKGQGIYYTPVPVVEYIVEKTVGKILEGQDILQISDVTVVDPACGSGSFLIKAFDIFVSYYEKEKQKFKEKRKDALGESVDNQTLDSDIMDGPIINYERNIVKKNLYGVDIDFQASEIASVNLILKSITPKEGLPLNLFENIKVGDSLLSGVDTGDGLNEYSHKIEKILFYREKIKKITDHDQRKEFEKKEREIREKLNSFFNKNLNKYFNGKEKEKEKENDLFLPFNWQIEFPEVFYPTSAKRGFTAVIGNPPWVSYGLRNVNKISKGLKSYYTTVFESAEYKISTYALFIQQGISLLEQGGVFGYIVPDSFLLGRYFSKIREYILESTKITEIVLILEDFWFYGTAGRSVILILDREKTQKLRRDNVMTVKCCKTLEDLKKRNFQRCQYTQAYFESVSHNRFRLFFDTASKEFVEKVEGISSFLCNFVLIYSGCIGRYGQESIIRDRKEKEFIIQRNEKIIYEDTNAFDKWQPVFRSGSNIGRYNQVDEGDYIYIEPDEERRKIYAKSGFDLEKYAGEKLFLRQTGDSLVAAFDDTGYYCLNNMHVVNLLTDVDRYSIKYILAILNSKFMNYFYHLISLEFGRALAQIDIDMVKELPIKEIDFENDQETKLYNTIIKKTDLMIVLNKQRMCILELFRKLIKKFRQDKGYRPFTEYYEAEKRVTLDSHIEESIFRVPRLYGIDYCGSEELLDYTESGIVTSVKVREEKDFVVISVSCEDKDTYIDILKIKFVNNLFKNFFSLAIKDFIIKNSLKRKWSTEKIFDVLNEFLIPIHAKNRKGDSENIIRMMEILKIEYEKIVEEKFLHSPIKEFDLTTVYTTIAQTDKEIDEIVYKLYQLDEKEIQLIEESEYW